MMHTILHIYSLCFLGPFTPVNITGIFPTERGTNFTNEVLYSANPFVPITSSNWTFVPINNNTMQDIPTGVNVSVLGTDHTVQKIVSFTIDNVTLDHYGLYTMVAQNEHGPGAVWTLLIYEPGENTINM